MLRASASEQSKPLGRYRASRTSSPASSSDRPCGPVGEARLLLCCGINSDRPTDSVMSLASTVDLFGHRLRWHAASSDARQHERNRAPGLGWRIGLRGSQAIGGGRALAPVGPVVDPPERNRVSSDPRSPPRRPALISSVSIRPKLGPRVRYLAPGEHVGEPPFGERAEERVPCQLRAARRRARDAGEESRLLSRRTERVGMVVAQRRERVDARRSLDRRLRLGLGKPLGAAGQAVAAVPARLRARLAEVADEGARPGSRRG